MKKAKHQKVDPKALSSLITYLDGYAALSVSDPIKIQRIARKYYEDPDIGSAWKEVAGDVTDIAALPSSSEDILKLSKTLRILRPVMMFLGLIVFTVYLVLAALGVMRELGDVGLIIFLVAFFGAYFLSYAVYFFLNRKLTRLVQAYYHKRMGEIAKQRRHIKLVNQRLIDKLAMIIRANNYDPSKYKFKLLNKDYVNITVIGEDRNSVYTVMVKGKSVTASKKE